MVTQLYLALVAVFAAERVVELFLSHRNARAVRARGGIEVGQGHYRVMVLLHTTFFVSCVFEVVWLEREPVLWITVAAVVALSVSMPLRYWAILSLGDRWNTRVLVEPGQPALVRGPYRFLRHPNYVAVVLEIAALPLVHGGWWTATFFSIANLLLLRVRIQVEETALREHCDYDRVFSSTQESS